jgi:thiol-disulfide isomerase/thioredoxin
MKILLLIFLFVTLSCSNNRNLDGKWLFTLNLQNNELPFIMEFKTINKQSVATLYNGKQTLKYSDITFDGKKLNLKFTPYNIGLEATYDGDELIGEYIKYDRLDYRIKFKAKRTSNLKRFKHLSEKLGVDITGKWKLDFFEKGKINSTMGLFSQKGNHLDATIRTTTGDYGFLEGVVQGEDFKMYSFDGSHSFIFTGKIDQKQILDGVFYAGKSWNQKFTGIQDNYFELPNPNKQTYLKKGSNKLNFSLKDLNAKLISLEDKELKGKVKVLQIFGSWCPNCLDETHFLSKWYEKNKHKNVEVIALSFERAGSEAKAFKNIKRVVDRTGATYPFLLAASDKSKFGPNKLFPELVNFISYPTTIYIDKNNIVRKIHAGFNGPATGKYFERFATEFDMFINKLLSE